MKALITGGAGFIGSHITATLASKGVEVVVVDDLSMGKKENIKGLKGVTFLKADVRNKEFMHELLKKEKFDYVLFLAAIASVADSVDRPMMTHSINQEAVLDTLDFIRQSKLSIKKFLFTSSAAVYGNAPELPKKENSTIDPQTPYAIDKFASERYVIDYGKLYDMPTVCVRFFNVYGPRQNPSSPYSGVISIITKCLMEGKTFTMYGDGSQTRDFIFIDDVSDAVVSLLENSKSPDVFNIARGEENSLNQLISTYEKVSGKKLSVDYQAERGGDIKRSVADVSKLTGTGFRPKVSLEDGLDIYWQYNQVRGMRK